MTIKKPSGCAINFKDQTTTESLSVSLQCTTARRGSTIKHILRNQAEDRDPKQGWPLLYSKEVFMFCLTDDEIVC